MTEQQSNTIKKQAPSIASSAMLCELNISLWTGRKLDKSVSEAVDIQNQTTTRAGNYHKKLFADEPRFEAIAKHAGNTRTFHYHNTMPWTDSGQRLLTTPMYFDYNSRMTNEQMRFYDLVQYCLDDWDNMMRRAEVKLGRLFNPEDYPTAEAIADKYAFSLRYSPVPEVGDFRVNVGNEALGYLQEQYEKQYQTQLEGAYKDVWGRLHEALTNMSSKLAGENKQVFRDTLVSNVTGIIDLLERFNITNDQTMHRAKQKVEHALMGVTPDALREDDAFRLDTKQRVDELLKEFAW